MRFAPSHAEAARARRAGFTLAEVLAALLFMAIVIPATIQAVRIANLAGQVGERRAAAARIAERVMNERVVAGSTLDTAQNGTIEEGARSYRWFMITEPWSEEAMTLVTVQVLFTVQGQDYDVLVSTLVDSGTESTLTL
jgi:type II secretory pathway component PulJ